MRRLSPKPWLPRIVLRLIHLDSPFPHFGTARCQNSSSPRVIKSTIAEQRVDQRDSGCNFQSPSHWESKHAKPTYNALSFGITVHSLPKTSKLKRPVPCCCREIKLFPYSQPHFVFIEGSAGKSFVSSNEDICSHGINIRPMPCKTFVHPCCAVHPPCMTPPTTTTTPFLATAHVSQFNECRNPPQ